MWKTGEWFLIETRPQKTLAKYAANHVRTLQKLDEIYTTIGKETLEVHFLGSVIKTSGEI